MRHAILDLWDTSPAALEPRQRPKSPRRVLVDALPLRTAYTTTGAWVRALLAEYQAAHDCERRARHYAGKCTTDGTERIQQLELADHHLRRQERVVMQFTGSLTRLAGNGM